MSRDRFKKTEDKLYNYFNKEKKIATLNYRIELLKKQIDKINQELRECDVNIEIESSSLGFEERVQTSSDGTSYAEREVIRITELKLKRKVSKEIEIEELKEEIENSILEYNLQYINEEWYKLLELKYKFKKNETQISLEMNISQSQVNKIKQKAIADIRRWEEWRKVE